MRRKRQARPGDIISFCFGEDNQLLQGEVIRKTSDFLEIKLDKPRIPLFYEKELDRIGYKQDYMKCSIYNAPGNYQIVKYKDDECSQSSQS